MIQIGERWRLVQTESGLWEAQEWSGRAWVMRWQGWAVDRPARAMGAWLSDQGCGEDLVALQTALGAIHAEIASALERAREKA